MYKKGLFHDWLPKLLQLLMIILCILPFLTLFGVYAGNTQEMASATGIMTEYLTLAYYATFIGMMGAMPLIMRTKQYFPSKVIVVGSFLMMIFLGWVCSTTDNGWLIIIASLLFGIFKMMGTVEFILPIYFIISPNFDRKVFYPIFYPIAIGLGQLSSWLFSQVAYLTSYTHVYLYANIYMLLMALLCTIIMHDSRAMKKLPLYQFDYTGMILFTLAMAVMGYIFIFAKFHGWMQSEAIIANIVALAVLTALFIIRETTVRRPFLTLRTFLKRNVYHANVIIVLLGIFLAAGSMQSTLMIGVLKYDSQTNMSLNLAMIPGLVGAGIFSFHWMKRHYSLRTLMIMGFLSYLSAHLITYFMIAPEVPYQYFIFPSLLKGIGLCILYVSVTYYSSINLETMEVLTASSLFILIRSFIGPALFGAIFSRMMYQIQWQTATDLASVIDASHYMTSMRGGGMALYGTVQIQSIMVAVKKIFGLTLAGGVVTILYIAFHQSLATPYEYIVLLRRKLKGRQYLLSPLHRKRKGVADTAPTAV